MSWPTEKDLEMLDKMPKAKLLELFFLHIKNLWRVDGLYFLGIEEKFSTDEATEIDARCWQIIGKLEARDLIEKLRLGERNIENLMLALRNTSWALYQIEKDFAADVYEGVLRVIRCRTQETRVNKGLCEFPCRKVRLGYLQSFANEFNPKIKVICKTCPPKKHPKNLWCEWEFTLRK